MGQGDLAEKCPDGFAARVTEATNTQNRVEARDFASLDPTQEAIREDLALSLGKVYIIKRGDQDPDPEVGCTIVEAARALAAANEDPSLAARAKQDDDSVLYEGGGGGTYRALFDPKPSAQRLWRSVVLVRRVREIIDHDREKREGRASSIADQSDLLVCHVLYRTAELPNLNAPDSLWNEAISSLSTKLPGIVDRMIASLDTKYGTSSSPAPSFRNAERCTAIAQAVVDSIESGEAIPDFPASYWFSNKRQGRRTNSVALVVDSGMIKDGTTLEFCGASPGEGRRAEAWFLANEKRRRASWVNSRSRPLIWEADGKSYSPSGLAKMILNQAGVQTIAVQGPLRWKVSGKGTIAEMAAQLHNS